MYLQTSDEENLILMILQSPKGRNFILENCENSTFLASLPDIQHL